MKREVIPEREQKSPPTAPQPEHGADSQLHCYNAVSWRLAEMFGDNEEPVEPSEKKPGA